MKGVLDKIDSSNGLVGGISARSCFKKRKKKRKRNGKGTVKDPRLVKLYYH